MIHTIKEARTKWCPLYRTPHDIASENADNKCCADKCMLWVNKNKYLYEGDYTFPDQENILFYAEIYERESKFSSRTHNLILRHQLDIEKLKTLNYRELNTRLGGLRGVGLKSIYEIYFKIARKIDVDEKGYCGLLISAEKFIKAING